MRITAVNATTFWRVCLLALLALSLGCGTKKDAAPEKGAGDSAEGKAETPAE